MKIIVFSVVAILCATASFMPPAFASEPCNMTLCMWGKIKGENSSECRDEISDFFKKKVTKHGGFLPDHTADARQKMLSDECPSGYDASKNIAEIISKFGRIKG